MMTEQTREQLIKRVTALRGEGKSRGEMAKTLNTEKLMTPAGKDWTDVLIGAFMNRMNITTSTPVKTEAKAKTTETKISGKEINKVMAKVKTPARSKTKVFKRQATVTAPVAARTATPGIDTDLVAIVTSVIVAPLTREQKVRAFTALI